MKRRKFIKKLMASGISRDQASSLSLLVAYFGDYNILGSVIELEMEKVLKELSYHSNKLRTMMPSILKLAKKYATGGRWCYYPRSIAELIHHEGAKRVFRGDTNHNYAVFSNIEPTHAPTYAPMNYPYHALNIKIKFPEEDVFCENP